MSDKDMEPINDEAFECPFCFPTFSNANAQWVVKLREKEKFAVACGQCHMSGPVADTEEMAVIMWNKLPRG